MKHSITGNIHLADDYSINIDKLFEEALKEVYGDALVEEAKKSLSPSLFKLTNEPLQHAVDSVFAEPEFGTPDQEFLNEFKYNTGVFAAFKAHAEQKLLVSLLLDEEGNLRSFSQFRKAVKGVNVQWNEQWLRTEYNTAVRSARAAANYRDALRSKDMYPNLEYLESIARDKREEHLSLVGTILPIDDPFWEVWLPPSEWNCECSFRATDKPATEVPVISEGIAPVFRNNPGKTAELVKLKEHPYLKGKGIHTCPECRRQGIVSGGTGEELCQMHKKARETEAQKLDSKETTKRLLAILKTKEVRYPEFDGKIGKFVRNSISENMRYGELYPIKKEVLENIEEYFASNYEHRFELNTKRDKKEKILGYHKFKVKYKGDNPIGKNRDIELQFEVRTTGDIVFHFIKLI
ncbi:MAG: phage minor head protein [Bacteroidales bacterium]|uniref:phage head morphogenesis protein n=1 Tax=Porphyromonas sp. TaxID=1924944 RepID=UPI002974532A|nr:phage minor head protein [Porphyromonas sp.]MDD7438589.1 phage minor head protein [Bacteroidales bacterium]MDY3067845.1 phage minor head protein [Porphyromonas sp.]